TALRDAVWKSLERPGTPVLWERRLRDARRALQVLGLTSEEIEREERVARDAFAEYERERAAVWSRDPKSVTTHELEALRRAAAAATPSRRSATTSPARAPPSSPAPSC